ncbi:hypothetical protein TeGR_g5085, partial [Tetraparma gracilis]
MGCIFSSEPGPSGTHDVRGNLMRSRQGVDVFSSYEKVKNIGEGSMGSVSMVRRKLTEKEQLGSFKAKGGASFDAGSAAGSPDSAGSQGKVMRRRSSKSSGLFALKSIQLSRMSDEFVEELKNEIDILKSLDHPNIVKPQEVFQRKRQMFIIMELCSGGDLYTRDPYTELQAASIAGQLLSAISCVAARAKARARRTCKECREAKARRKERAR